MFKLKLSILVLIYSIILFGCVSFPEANEKNQTLIVGVITQHGKGYQTYGSVSVNGTNKKGIKFTIQEVTEKKTYTMRTGYDGFLYSLRIPAGKYKITKVFLKS